MNSRRSSAGLLGALALIGWSLAPRVAHAQEAHAYGISQFGMSGQCGSVDQTHAVHAVTSNAFMMPFTLMAASGRWTQALVRNDSIARGSFFTDASKAATCSCTADDLRTDYGADEADVVFVHTHGGRTTSAPYYTSLLMGNSDYDCRVRTNENMLFGNNDGDLDIAVVKACQSGDYNVWQNGGYRQQITTPTSSLSVWNAFHGDSSCGGHVAAYTLFYSFASEYDGVGENWIDAAYDDSDDPNDDDCPVSIVMGSSASARELMYEHGGWNDRKNTGSKTGSSYFYIPGCDPSNGVALPE